MRTAAASCWKGLPVKEKVCAAIATGSNTIEFDSVGKPANHRTPHHATVRLPRKYRHVLLANAVEQPALRQVRLAARSTTNAKHVLSDVHAAEASEALVPGRQRRSKLGWSRLNRAV